MVYAAVQREAESDFDAFAEHNPDLLDKGLIDRYYSKALLQSAEARATWVEPDLMTLPIAER
jgi:hypothetical protein